MSPHSMSPHWGFVDKTLILASKSQARAALLTQAGIQFDISAAAIDESAIREAAIHEGASPDDIALLLAEMKGERVAASHPEALVIASDQLLLCDGKIYGKPRDKAQAHEQIKQLSSRRHQLISAVILFDKGRRIWHHITRPEITFHKLSDNDISAYLTYVGNDALYSPGSYFLEGPGIHLFADVFGDYYAILGLPMLALLPQLKLHGLQLINEGTE